MTTRLTARPGPASETMERFDRLVEEGLIGASAIARLMGRYRGEKPCHPSTVTRWCLQGVRLPGGATVRLEHVRVAGRVMSTRPALLRFLAVQAASDPAPTPPRAPAERTRASDAVARRLEEAGI